MNDLLEVSGFLGDEGADVWGRYRGSQVTTENTRGGWIGQQQGWAH